MHGINWIITENITSQVVKRYNVTLKSKMFKYITRTETKNWLKVLDTLIEDYNKGYLKTKMSSKRESARKKGENCL